MQKIYILFMYIFSELINYQICTAVYWTTMTI